MALSTNWAQTNIVNKWSELREELDEEKEEKERIKFPPSRNGPAGACLQVVITCGHTPALFFPCNKLFILLPYSSSSSSPLHRRENQTWLVFHQLLFWLSGHVDSSLTHYPVSLTTSCFFFSQISPWWEMDREMSLEGPNRTQKSCVYFYYYVVVVAFQHKLAIVATLKVVLTPRLLLPTTTVPLFV